MRTTIGVLLLVMVVPAATLVAQEMRGETTDEIRTRVRATAIGTELSGTLESGESFAGELTDIGGEDFGIWLDERTTQENIAVKRGRMKKHIRYDEVSTLHGAVSVAVSSDELRYRMRIGDHIRLQPTNGGKVSGKVEEFDGDLVRVDGKNYRLSEEDVQQIDLRMDDSVKNGALIGAAIGAGFIGLGCISGCDPAAAAGAALFTVGAGAGLGVLFDSLRHGHQVVYVLPESKTTWSIVPILGRDRKGAFLRVSF